MSNVYNFYRASSYTLKWGFIYAFVSTAGIFLVHFKLHLDSGLEERKKRKQGKRRMKKVFMRSGGGRTWIKKTSFSLGDTNYYNRNINI